jgi:hypothetical protein
MFEIVIFQIRVGCIVTDPHFYVKSILPKAFCHQHHSNKCSFQLLIFQANLSLPAGKQMKIEIVMQVADTGEQSSSLI